jgi:hypothetical protein
MSYLKSGGDVVENMIVINWLCKIDLYYQCIFLFLKFLWVSEMR